MWGTVTRNEETPVIICESHVNRVFPALFGDVLMTYVWRNDNDDRICNTTSLYAVYSDARYFRRWSCQRIPIAAMFRIETVRATITVQRRRVAERNGIISLLNDARDAASETRHAISTCVSRWSQRGRVDSRITWWHPQSRKYDIE